MNLTRPVLILLAIAGLGACASTGTPVMFSDDFVTEISADGTKFFTYTRRYREQAGANAHGKENKDADTALQKSIQEKLDTSGYCRDGYLTLEEYEANSIVRIRGECRDGASDDDRRQFTGHN